MSYTAHPTVVTGQTWTAANQNTYVRDNLAALWVFTTAGDMIYATSSSVAARLAPPAGGGYYMGHSGSAPQWTAFYRYVTALLNVDVPLVVGDDAYRFRIPAALDGWNISTVAGSRKSGTGVPAIQIRNVTDGVDVLSTKLTIDSGETDSITAAVPRVINTANDDVATADQFALDVDVAGTNTLYMFVEIGFLKP